MAEIAKENTKKIDKTKEVEQKNLPFIKKEEVINTFRDFGFEPTKVDVAYWTRKREDSLDDMVEKLNTKSDEKGQINAQSPMPLAEDITDLQIDDDLALIKFDSDPDGSGPNDARTVWMADPKKKTLTPFNSEDAFNNYFQSNGLTMQKAVEQNLVYTVPTSLLSNGLALSSYKMLTNKQGVQDGGTIPKDNSIDESKIAQRYGQPFNQELFDKAGSLLGNPKKGIYSQARNNPESGISSQLMDEIVRDPTKVALHQNALAFGRYTPKSIFKDLKRQELLRKQNN